MTDSLERSAEPPVAPLRPPQNHQHSTIRGLTEAEATALLYKWGPNDIPVAEKSSVALFLEQFIGTMPFILELCVVISAAVQDWPDFAVILAMLLVNAYMGMREQLKAKAALATLTSRMVSSVSVARDGANSMLPVTQLVPGDVIHLEGGTLIPADVQWLKGDTLSIDTSALTGEMVPRKYPSDAYGKLLLGGSTVKEGEAYCLVVATGARTEIGQGQLEITNDRRKGASVSVFERKTLKVVKVIILIAVFVAIVVILIQGIVRKVRK